jgi:hypothetical protein
MRLNLALGVCAIVIAVATLSGCAAAPNLNDYASVRAKLDPAAGTIQLPLDQYAMSARESDVVQHANALLVKGCMAKSGLEYPRATENWDTKAVPQDRRYGLWSMDMAQKFGYDLPEDSRSKAIDKIEATLPDSWWTAWNQCIDQKVKQLPLMGELENAGHLSPVDSGIVEAHNELVASSTYSKVWSSWSDCITKAGLLPEKDKGVMAPQLPKSVESQARAAVIDVGCKQKINAIQTLADIEAKYQMAYIDQNESALVAYRSKADTVLVHARQIIAASGS